MTQLFKILNSKFASLLVISLLYTSLSFSQNVTGPTAVAPGSTHTYNYSDGGLHRFSFNVTGGTVVSTSVNSQTLTWSAVVQWNTNVSSGQVTFLSSNNPLNTLNVSFTGGSSVTTSTNTNLSNENYVHTLVPRIETTNTTTLTNNEKIESVTYFDGLGRAKQSIAIRAGGAVTNNFISKNSNTTLSTPTLAGLNVDWTLGQGSTPNFIGYGDANENTRVIGVAPTGKSEILWECSNNASSAKSDGGFYSKYFNIDKNSSYIFSVWVKKENNLIDGGIYFGTTNVSTLAGVPNSNPYFVPNKDLPELNKWYLLVGVVHPHNYTGADTGLSGIYDAQGNRIFDGVEWKWDSTKTTSRMRALQYNASNTTTKQYFWRPSVQKMNVAPGSFTLDWNEGAGSTPFFNLNGSVQENKRIYGTAPNGKTELLWKCDSDANSNADGGWNTDYFPIDKTKTYRYTTWVKRTGSQNGKTYHGTQLVNTLAGVEHGNPYFWYGDLPELNQWYLLVGVIHPYNYTGGNSGESGVYDMQGNKVLNGNDFKWRPTSTQTRLRSYLYYNTDANTKQYFWSPHFQQANRPLDVSSSSIANKDIVTHIDYDQYGRAEKEYLPYAQTNNGGAYVNNALSATNAFYNTPKYENTVNPFSQKEFEASPLNRVFKQAAPGQDWAMGSGHEIELDYQTNSTNEVRLYRVNTTLQTSGTAKTFNPTLVANLGFYNPGELYKSITKDENHTGTTKNHTTEEFKDAEGRVILKRTYADFDINNNGSVETNETQIKHDTYYVYDDYGNLTYVLPPKVVHDTAISGTELNELCYQYKYDHRNRLVEKKIPGKNWEYIVYNKLDQPIMTQDANLRTQGKWLFTRYDAFGRVAYTGINNNGGARAARQNSANNTAAQYVEKRNTPITIAGTTIYYSNAGYSWSDVLEIHTINYYDDYTFDKATLTLPSSADGQSVINYNNASSTRKLTKGLATGSKVRVLGTNNWITTITGYDVKGRPIVVKSRNTYLQTTDVVTSKLDFTGNVVSSNTTHSKTNQVTITTADNFEYDHMNRLLKQEQSINGQTNEVIVENTYDEIGQLENKGVGGKTNQVRLQNVDYTYNIRGWLKQINNPTALGNDLFGFKINYNTANHGAEKLFNGNISETEWRTANIDNSIKWYRYSYDALNRITKAYEKDNKYTLSLVEYDKNGNIERLARRGAVNTAATSFTLWITLPIPIKAINS